jgi:hypothetical protein
MSDEFEKTIWNAMLDAEMNVLYFEYLGNAYAKKDKCLKIFLAIISSGSVASWTIVSGYDIIWKILTIVTALIATVYPFLGWNEQLRKISSIRSHWIEIFHDTESLWIEYSEKPSKRGLKDNLRIIKKDIAKVLVEEDFLSKNSNLQNKCYNEIRKKRGSLSEKDES